MFLHILSGRHAVELLEDGGERGSIAETAGIDHLGHIHIALGQEVGRLFEPNVPHEVVRCLPGEFLHLAVQVHAADAHGCCEVVDVEIAV